MAKEVNVLVFGHPGSGKSSIISKVLELGKQLTKEQIEIYKTKSKDDNQTKEKPDWYLHYAKGAKKSTFAKTFYQAEGRKFMFLEFQSEEDPKLMVKTKQATIGVLVLSSTFRNLEAFQTRKFLQLFRAIRGSSDSVLNVSSKLIFLINKTHSPNLHSDDIKGLKSFLAGYLEGYGFDSSKVEIILVSSRTDEDILSFLSRLKALAASENNCLRAELCEEIDPTDSIFKRMWDALLITDAQLDDNFSDKSLWRNRAKILYQAGIELLDSDEAVENLESSSIIKVACKAAEKAIIKDEDDILLCLILSHVNYMDGNYQMCVKNYEKAELAYKKAELASKDEHDEHLKDNINRYLFLGEIHADDAKAKMPVEPSGKSRRKNKQKVEKKVDKSDATLSDAKENEEVETPRSDAKEHEEAKTSGVRDKPEDLEIPRKMISAMPSSTYLINPVKRDTLYSGSRMISGSSVNKAFIPILSELDYNAIESLGFQHPNMIGLNEITNCVIGDTHMLLLVAEDVDTLDWFFNGMLCKFMEDYKSNVEVVRSKWSIDQKKAFMKSWWDLIADDFQIIFGDVVNGMLYLYSLGMPSGGLRDHIYVSRDKRGRILPRMDKGKTYRS